MLLGSRREPLATRMKPKEGHAMIMQVGQLSLHLPQGGKKAHDAPCISRGQALHPVIGVSKVCGVHPILQDNSPAPRTSQAWLV